MPPTTDNTTGSAHHQKSGIRRRHRWLLVGVGICFLLLIADFFAYQRLPADGPTLNRGENGSWIRDTWYFGQSNEPVATLVARLKRQQVRYAYFHVRYIKKDGRLRYRYPEQARTLVREMHHLAPDIKCVAWVYIGNTHGMTGVNLEEERVRSNAVQEANWLVQKCGFDGVQWDYEMCQSGETGFLALLDETRRVLPKGTLLSVATPVYLPVTVSYWGWSKEYYARVARRCDQIAVMTYDTGMYLPRAYAALMAMETEVITQVVAKNNPACRVLMGFPTYSKGGASHFAPAENITVALKGIRDGLAAPHTRTDVFAGVANFADYTTSPEEERAYQWLWLEGR